MENNLKENVVQIFDGIESVLNTKTVVGEAIKTQDATIIPLLELSCGMGVGCFNGKNDESKTAGGMSTRVTPVAVLVVQKGYTKLINIKNQDALSKIVDIFPDILSKITGKSNVSPEVQDVIDDIDVEFYNE